MLVIEEKRVREESMKALPGFLDQDLEMLQVAGMVRYREKWTATHVQEPLIDAIQCLYHHMHVHVGR